MARLTQSYLRWIRPGLDELIQQAQVALESHATEAKPEHLDSCLEQLHLIHATLQMVQIYGIGLLLEEMLLLGQALKAQQVTKVDEALEAMMAAMVLISDRLDRFAQGEDDSPIAMLGILNDLRACRDAPLMSSLSLFGNDLGQQISELYARAGNGNPQMSRIAEKLRASFHKGLLHWLRHPGTKDGLVLVQAVLDKFVEYSGAEPTKVFFQALAALVQSLASDSLETGVTVKRLMSRSDREIKLLVDGGEEAFIKDPEPELFKNILYYVANSSSQDVRVTSTLARFNLKSLHGIKTNAETLAGVNQELLTAVSDALRDDLLQIKDGLDDFIKDDSENLAALEPLHSSLMRLADTIGMLGQGSLRLELKQQAEKLADWMAKSQMPKESELMDLAAKVINVELSLDQLSKFQGGQLKETSLPAFTRDELMIATLRESAVEIAHIKEQLGLYLEHPANGMPANLTGRFNMILGALGMLQLAEPEALLRFACAYISERLGGTQLPPGSELADLADLLASIEYFMDSIAQELGLEEPILDFARRAKERLESPATNAAPEAEPQPRGEAQAETEAQVQATQSAEAAIQEPPPASEPETRPEAASEADQTGQTDQAEAAEQQPFATETTAEEPITLVESGVSPEAEEEPEVEETLELQPVTAEVKEEPEVEETLELQPVITEAEEEPEVEETLELQPVAAEVEEEPEVEETLELQPVAAEVEEEPEVEETLELQPVATEAEEEPEVEETLELQPLVDEEQLAPESVPPPLQPSLTTDGDRDQGFSPPSVLELKVEDILGAEVETLPLPESEHLSIEAPIPAPAPTPVPTPAPAPKAAAPAEDVDSEILDIFLEEAEEEKDAILEHLPLWLADATDDAALVRVRRAFHTLKGSGRLVGAKVLGDFAWAVENLLNKVLEGTIGPSENLTAHLQEVLDILPSIIERERTRVPHPVDSYEAISANGFALAEGRAPSRTASSTTASPAQPDKGQDIRGGAVQETALPDFLAFDESKALAEELAPPEDVLGQQDSLLYTTWGNEDPETLMIESRLVHEMDQVLAGGADLLLPLDETLLRILEPECRARLKTIDALVKAGSASWLTKDKTAIMDALQAIAESASTTEITPIARIARACESCFRVILNSGLSAGSQDARLLARTSDLVDQLLGIINKPDAVMPDWRQLLIDLEGRLVQLEVETSSDRADADHGAIGLGLDNTPWSRSADDTTFISEDPFLEALGMTTENHESTPAAGYQMPEIPAPPLEMALPDEPMPFILEDFIPEDPELLEVFLEEAQELGERLDAALQNWLADTHDRTAMDELKRVLHTLKGSSRLAGVLQIGDLSHAYESFFIALDHGSLAHNEQLEEIARQVADFLLAQIETLARSGQIASSKAWLDILGAAQRGEFSGQGRPASLKGTDTTRTQAQQTTAESPSKERPVAAEPKEAASTGTLDDELRLLDSLAEIASMEQALKDLEEPAPVMAATKAAEELPLEDELKTLENLGDAQAPVAAESLALEDEFKALENLGDDRVPVAAESLALEDELKALADLEFPAAPKPVPEVQPRAIPRVAETRPAAPLKAPPTAPPTVPPVSQSAPQSVTKPETTKPTGEARPKAPPQAPQVPQPQAQPKTGLAPSAAESQAKQELIRVRADRLDQMVNNAGEISIFRARIEQQSGILGFNLEELYQTLYRMRNQLRRLEIETEAQIQFRYDQVKEESAGPDANFDPLEMDRFSSMQQISRALAETLDDLVNLNETMVETNRTTETLLLQQSRVNNDLQDSLLRTRMVSFSQAVPRLQRLVRQTALTLGKKGELLVKGGGGELDRSILDRILAPLEHILRNALSHGIEAPEERRQKGKPDTGQITLSLLREGKDMLIRVEDDGGGINTKAIRKKAIERGLLDANAEVTEDELIQFLLESGFSTAAQVSQVAGRGVGMDVVVSEVKQLGGVLDISSNPGQGSRFDIRLPFTLSLTETLLVGVGEDIFAVPHTSIEGVIRMSREQLEACYLGAQEGVSYAGNAYRVHYLAELLGFVETGGNYFPEERKWYPMLLVRHGELRVAIHADRMLGSRQIVVKSVGPQLSTVRWITGGTILADGRVALILDVTTLVRLAVRSQAKILKPGEDSYRAIPVAEKPPAPKATVMVVDDSVTVRKVSSRLLTRNDFNAITAKDGVDALGQLQDVIPDLMLLDIEMPRMDGYELTRHIRHDEKLKNIPIIMITSRTGDKHRQMALDLGVNLYLGKPFQEAELLESIRSLLPEKSTYEAFDD